MSQMSFQPSVS